MYTWFKNFTESETFALALLISVFLIWGIAITTWVAARKVRKNSRSITPEYEPPEGLSPAFARFILVSGREGGMTGEISKSGIQLLTLINLYEDGLLKKLVMVDDETVEYEISKEYKAMECSREEIMFLDRMSQKIGMTGTLQQTLDPKSKVDGYLALNDVWFDFWHTDLVKFAGDQGLVDKKVGVLVMALSFFSASLTFGGFFSFFAFLIPYIGIFIAGLLLLPVLVVFGVGYLGAALIIANVNFPWEVLVILMPAIKIFGFLSWFAWFIIFGQNMSKLNQKLTPKGLEVVRKLQGYKEYLKTVDTKRLSFSFNRKNDITRNQTSFSWLGVFEILEDEHWNQWYEIAKPTMVDKIEVNPKVVV